jgi:hypothetical protein
MPKDTAILSRPLLKSDFSWNTTTLQHSIKEHDAHYNPRDQKTWQRADLVFMYDYDGKRALPHGVAYSRTIVDMYVKHHPDQKVKVRETGSQLFELNDYFLRFPYHYNPDGTTRNGETMTAAAYKLWMNAVVGSVPDLKGDSAQNLPTPRRMNTKTPSVLSSTQMLSSTRTRATASTGTVASNLALQKAQKILRDEAA